MRIRKKVGKGFVKNDLSYSPPRHKGGEGLSFNLIWQFSYSPVLQPLKGPKNVVFSSYQNHYYDCKYDIYTSSKLGHHSFL